jgi:hypothetical protein
MLQDIKEMQHAQRVSERTLSEMASIWRILAMSSAVLTDFLMA